MTLKEAIERCHVRSAVRRKSYPYVTFWKNNSKNIISRVPFLWRFARDWEEYDPREAGQ